MLRMVKGACRSQEFDLHQLRHLSHPNFQWFSNFDDIPISIRLSLPDASNDLFSLPPFWEAIPEAQPQLVQSAFLLLKSSGQPLAILPMHRLVIDGKSIHLDPSLARLSNKRFWLKKLADQIQLKLLITGHPFLTGAWYAQPEAANNPKVADLFMQALSETQRRSRNLFWDAHMIKDVPSSQTQWNASLKNAGYFPYSAQPNMILQLPKHWQTPEDYLLDMHSKYRIRMRKALQRSSIIQIKTLYHQSHKVHQADMQAVCDQIMKNAYFRLVEPNVRWVCHLQEHLPGQMHVKGFFDENKLVGFISFLIHQNQLYAGFTGMEERYIRENDLYLRMLLELIFTGIDHQVTKIHFGRTATEIKSSVGALPFDDVVWLKHRNPWMHRFFEWLVLRLSVHETVHIRNPFKKGNDTNTSSQ